MMTTTPLTDTPDIQADTVAFLERSDTLGASPKRIDTHCASVFLAGDRAWKLKRAVRFDYLDFSTAALRRKALEAELGLNQRTAPSLYLALHTIAQEPDGELKLDGKGEVIDWLLEMRRFPDDALLEQQAAQGQLDESLLMRLANRIHAFHADAEIYPKAEGAARIRKVVEGAIRDMEAFPDILDPSLTKHVAEQLRRQTDEMAPLLDERALGGRVRHGHGDLHLANIALIDGELTPFDCLEFSAELATIDVLYDLTYLLMDLWHRDLRTAANIVFNRYLDLSPLDEDGIALMPLFLSLRASIRAHVLAARSRRGEDDDGTHRRSARAYLDLSLRVLTPVPARLVAIGGLSGTGKSSLACRLGGYIGRAPGARILRNDVLRKRLAQLPPEAPIPREEYTLQAAARVYATLDQMAVTTLALAHGVIADAVFAQPVERTRIERVAHQLDVPFAGLWLELADDARIARVAARGVDASDADAAVARRQSRIDTGDIGDWRALSVNGSLDDVAAEARAMLACTDNAAQARR